MRDAQTLLMMLSYTEKVPDLWGIYIERLKTCFPDIYAAFVLRESLLNYSMVAILSVQESTMISQLLDSLNEKLKFEPDTPKTLFKED